MIVPDAMKALAASTGKSGVPERTLELVNLRTSEITGCSACVDMHPRVAKKAGETDERLFDRGSLLGGETPYFTDAERAALALTRVSDRPDAVSDEV